MDRFFSQRDVSPPRSARTRSIAQSSASLQSEGCTINLHHHFERSPTPPHLSPPPRLRESRTRISSPPYRRQQLTAEGWAHSPADRHNGAHAIDPSEIRDQINEISERLARVNRDRDHHHPESRSQRLQYST